MLQIQSQRMNVVDLRVHSNLHVFVLSFFFSTISERLIHNTTQYRSAIIVNDHDKSLRSSVKLIYSSYTCMHIFLRRQNRSKSTKIVCTRNVVRSVSSIACSLYTRARVCVCVCVCVCALARAIVPLQTRYSLAPRK